MNRQELQDLLPHRDPMLLVDSTRMDADGTGHGFYRIPDDPFYCHGHFPGNPIVPGVILCEIMAQSCCQLFPSIFEDHLVLYRGMDDVKFRGTVKPGDECEVICHLLDRKGILFLCDAVLTVGGKRCAQARFTLAATPK